MFNTSFIMKIRMCCFFNISVSILYLNHAIIYQIFVMKGLQNLAINYSTNKVGLKFCICVTKMYM